MKNHMVVVFYNVNNLLAFNSAIQTAINQVPPQGIYIGDNLITYGRNLSFLDDERLMAAFEKHAETQVEKAVLWRYNTLCWAAKRTMGLDGDMVECACYKGTSARIVTDYVDLNASDKSFYLYDLFEHDESQAHLDMAEHSADLFGMVKTRFSDIPNAVVTQGSVPQILDEVAPEKIAYLHLDLNDADAELGALKFFWDRIVPGGSIVLDDYGWIFYRAQKLAEDRFFAERGYGVMELPTGQGLVIK